MDDLDLTNDRAPEAESDSPSPWGGNLDGEAPASTPSQPSKASEGKQAPKGVNLYDLPEFREYQSQRDKTEARKFQEMESRLQQQMQQVQDAYERRIAELETRDMPDEQRAIYQRDRALQQTAQRAQALEQQLRQLQAEQAKNHVLAQIAEETGAPLAVLKDARDPDHAWKLGMDHMKKQLQQLQKQEQRQAKAEANAVDLGGGGRIAPSLDRKFKEAKTAVDFARIMFQPDEE